MGESLYESTIITSIAAAARISPFAVELSEELVRATRKHRTLGSLQEAFAVLYEEVDELWEEVRKRREDRDPRLVRRELVQIGAMAWRAAIDLGLTPGPPAVEPSITRERHDSEIDHPALDLVHMILDAHRWDVARLDRRVEFTDDDGRTCEVVVRVIDEGDLESEGEVMPAGPGEAIDDDQAG